MNYHFDTLNDDVVLIDCHGNVEWVGVTTTSIPSDGVIEVSVDLVGFHDTNLRHDLDEDDAVAVRENMKDWLQGNGYTTRIDVDFADQGSVIAGSLAAKTIMARFFEGDYAPLIDRYQVYWINENTTGIIEDRSFVSLRSATAYTMIGFIAPFLSIAGEHEVENILNGMVYITRTHGEFRDIPYDPRDLLEIYKRSPAAA
jgi:hypothetical protein